jgi:predicted nucleic acid-binding protein
MSTRTPLVVDTNVVLDLFIFADPDALPLRTRLARGDFDWLATAAMRSELERVLGYAHLLPRMAYYQTDAQQVLDQFDRHTRSVPTAPAVPVLCKDRDDQKFIDLAVQQRALLLSKDKAVLKLRRRLLALGVPTACALRLLPAAPLGPS